MLSLFVKMSQSQIKTPANLSQPKRKHMLAHQCTP